MKKVGVCWSIFFLPQNIARGKSKIKILLSFLWAAAEILSSSSPARVKRSQFNKLEKMMGSFPVSQEERRWFTSLLG